LDEPTGGLDPNQVIEIRELIKKLGKTTLLSTHIMQEVEAVCTRVVIIDKGNLVADSPIEKLANITGEKHHVNATFGSAINVKELSQLDEVIHVTDKGNNRYRIEVSSAEGRKSISHFALKNNLEVMELSSENVSLEQVFQNLTKHVDHL
jgi:ABC-2 type transport system ATP-binding protein